MSNFNEDSAILILSDMEGVSGLIDKRLVFSGTPFWREYGRHLLTDDINTVAEACFKQGFKTIYLSEAHYTGKNTVPESLLPFIRVLPSCSAQTNLKGVKIWDEIYKDKNIVAAIMVGIHSMENTNGYLAHSWDGNIFKNIKINGEIHGEIGTIAALLGYYDIPLISIVGDSEAAKEAGECIKGIKAISIKELGKDGWIKALPPDKAHEIIYKEILSCLEDFSMIKPFKLNGNVTMSFELKDKTKLKSFENYNGVSIINDVISINAIDYKEAYNIFWNCYLKIWLE
ncbi:M55 family metallopeptidase [Alkaliphilus serpentinus]|uniref:M55 family metallopeptidase n=1 Tax=Alkaliphilus serpentinus TaxID=1482731 RepID=A0A833HL44_9FIRM|nr:M55 family metallopeptidase [Alkaliphilus serpentinus]KAB3524915.1 M55 family metallopeptidase [Alkaliphilus serpentinus]